MFRDETAACFDELLRFCVSIRPRYTKTSAHHECLSAVQTFQAVSSVWKHFVFVFRSFRSCFSSLLCTIWTRILSKAWCIFGRKLEKLQIKQSYVLLFAFYPCITYFWNKNFPSFLKTFDSKIIVKFLHLIYTVDKKTKYFSINS